MQIYDPRLRITFAFPTESHDGYVHSCFVPVVDFTYGFDAIEDPIDRCRLLGEGIEWSSRFRVCLNIDRTCWCWLTSDCRVRMWWEYLNVECNRSCGIPCRSRIFVVNNGLFDHSSYSQRHLIFRSLSSLFFQSFRSNRPAPPPRRSRVRCRVDSYVRSTRAGELQGRDRYDSLDFRPLPFLVPSKFRSPSTRGLSRKVSKQRSFLRQTTGLTIAQAPAGKKKSHLVDWNTFFLLDFFFEVPDRLVGSDPDCNCLCSQRLNKDLNEVLGESRGNFDLQTTSDVLAFQLRFNRSSIAHVYRYKLFDQSFGSGNAIKPVLLRCDNVVLQRWRPFDVTPVVAR